MTAPNSAALVELSWPFERAEEALECLARAAGFSPRDKADSRIGVAPANSEAQARVIEAASERLGVGVQAVSESHSGIAHSLRRCVPALLVIGVGEAAALLAVFGSDARSLTVLAPGGGRRRVSVAQLCTALTAPLEAPIATSIDALLGSAGIPAARRARARQALLEERLGHVEIELGWLVRPASDRAPSKARYRSGLKIVSIVLGLYAAQYLLLGWAWRCAASGALLGTVDVGWLAAWALSLVSAVPLQAAVAWRSARLTLDAGSWLRVRMLDGILRQDPPTIRRLGTGQLLSRVLDAGSLDALSLGGGLLALFAVVDLMTAGALLAAGVASLGLLLLFALLLIGSSWVAHRYFQERQRWTEARLGLTHDLVERMIGHRTRIVQESPLHRHAGEDPLLADYAERSLRLDRVTTLFSSIPRLWLLASFTLLSFVFLTGAESKVRLAVTLGGIVIAGRALGTVSTALGQICSAIIAWRHVRPLVKSPSDGECSQARLADPTPSPTLLEARDLSIRVPDRADPLLTQANLTIREGDAVLLEGRSGSGKSSLARVLAGFNRPERGLLLSCGLDPQSLGRSGWNERVTLVPQFNDNHVLGGSFAYNVLLGRRWPARREELARAETVCRELGLGPLLDRMPAGMLQTVGETGWQLSHGERSRLFAARALTSGAQFVILDESAAALDPESTELVLDCARRRARALLLIQHP